MRKVLLFVLMVCFSSSWSFLLKAQEKAIYQVSGQILDEAGNPVANALVELSNVADAKEVYYDISDKEGIFTMKAISKPGNYQFLASLQGYDNLSQFVEISESQKTILQIGKLNLKKATATQLEGVEVTARKKSAIEVLPDKVVFNVQNSATSSGLNGMDLLRKSPGVYVDNDNNIIVKGNSGVRVFLNGKPSYMEGKQLQQFLSGLRAEEIEKIEIISSPSAQYEAEGTAGIINIVLRKGSDRKGITGTLNADGAGVIYTGKYQGSYSALLSYVNKGTTLTGSYSLSHGNGFFRFGADRKQDQYYVENAFFDNGYLNHNINLSLEQEINKQHSFSIGSRISFFEDNDMQTSNSYLYSLLNSQKGSYLRNVYSPNRSNDNDIQMVPNVGYTYKNEKFGELAFNADYSYYKNDGKINSDNLFYTELARTQLDSTKNIQQIPATTTNIWAAKLDWNKTKDKWSWKAGLKYSNYGAQKSFRQIPVSSTGQAGNVDLTKSNIFEYDESILAAYVEAGLQLKKWKLFFGLRDEFTLTNIASKHITTGVVTEKKDRNYNNIFPSGGITFNPSEVHALSLQYSRRLRRPPYDALNPFERQESQFSYEIGNPNLLPEYSDKLELNYTLNYMHNFSLSYTVTEGIIFQSFEQVGSISYRTQRNIGKRDVWNFSFSSPIAFKKISWLSGFIALNGSYFTNQGVVNNQNLSISAFGANGYAEISFRLPKKFSFQISGWAVTPSVWAASIEHEGFGSFDIALTKKLFDDKLTVKLYFQDVFETTIIHFKNQAVGALLDNGFANWAARRAGINIAYTFGSKDQMRRSKKSSALEEEENRMKGGGGGFGSNN